MVTRPKVLDRSSTAGSVRELFRNDHVHMALVVRADGHLLTTIERADVDRAVDDHAPAYILGTCEARTTRADAPLTVALREMRAANRRRLAVVDDDGVLVGLLCLKRTRHGFCSDSNVAERHASKSTSVQR
jgi:CBS domain-containing protein